MAYGSFGVLFTGYSPDAHPRYLDYIGFRLERKEEGSKIEEQAMLSQMVRKTGGRHRCEKIPPGFTLSIWGAKVHFQPENRPEMHKNPIANMK